MIDARQVKPWLLTDGRTFDTVWLPGTGPSLPASHLTVGLLEFGVPEVLTYGLPEDRGHVVIATLGRRLLEGERFADGEQIPDVYADAATPAQLWSMTWNGRALDAPGLFYAEPRGRQLVLPDVENRMPWDDDSLHKTSVPLHFVPPTGLGPRWVYDRQVGPSEKSPPRSCGRTVTGWDLPHEPCRLALVSSGVLRGRTTRMASVDESGTWEFTDRLVDITAMRGRCLHTAVALDPTLADVIRFLPANLPAYREAAWVPWRLHSTPDLGPLPSPLRRTIIRRVPRRVLRTWDRLTIRHTAAW